MKPRRLARIARIGLDPIARPMGTNPGATKRLQKSRYQRFRRTRRGWYELP